MKLVFNKEEYNIKNELKIQNKKEDIIHSVIKRLNKRLKKGHNPVVRCHYWGNEVSELAASLARNELYNNHKINTANASDLFTRSFMAAPLGYKGKLHTMDSSDIYIKKR